MSKRKPDEQEGGKNKLKKASFPLDKSPEHLLSSGSIFGKALPHNWQSTTTKLRQGFGVLYNNEFLSDVHFVVGKDEQKQRIPAHKLVLSVRSAVFEAMFNGEMANPSDKDVELPDVEPAAFLAFLKFCYSDNVNVEPDTVISTLYVAKKYCVPALESICIRFLEKNLSSKNAFAMLTQAQLFNEPQLTAYCVKKINRHTKVALSSEGFLDINLDILCSLLEADRLRIRELDLFQAVQRWSERECERRELPVTAENQRTVLGRAVSLIRFPLMLVEEFSKYVAKSGLLSDSDVISLLLYFTAKQTPICFPNLPRYRAPSREQTICRFPQGDGIPADGQRTGWDCTGKWNTVLFTVDRRIFILGLGLYCSIQEQADYEVELQMIKVETRNIIGSNYMRVSTVRSSSTFKAFFKHPIHIAPNVTYAACASLKGPRSCFGTNGYETVTMNCVTGSTVTFRFFKGNDQQHTGQIPEILFYTE